MSNKTSEDIIRIRVLPEEATEVAEWAGLMLSELVGDEASTDGTPVRLRDPERAAELLELLMLCAEEGADASSALQPAVSVLDAMQGEAEPNESTLQANPYPSSFSSVQSAEWHPYYGSGVPSFIDEMEESEPAAYRTEEERNEVLMAVRFGASALIDLARSHGVEVPQAAKPKSKPKSYSSSLF